MWEQRNYLRRSVSSRILGNEYTDGRWSYRILLSILGLIYAIGFSLFNSISLTPKILRQA